MKHSILGVRDLEVNEVDLLFDVTASLKRHRAPAEDRSLFGKTVALLFQHPSLRTRASFDIAVHELGGHPLYFGNDEVRMGSREAPEDVARVLARYAHAVVARLRNHTELQRFSDASTVPVINALTDREHPCQALADLFTLQEARGTLQGAHLAYVGDADNNVATSLLLLAPLLGVRMTMIAPRQHQPQPGVVVQARQGALAPVDVVDSLGDAELSSVDALYTDVWVSMGQENEARARQVALAPFQINDELLRRCRPQCIVLHCLPAKRGQEITDNVLDGPQSRVFDQAENRLHVQKALLKMLVS
ncbi:MAG: ornithine carbamoyltransferase [Chloroflexi bacterium]|nr:ornithine carbamoyltransferase [Chloroflexota bacterium]